MVFSLKTMVSLQIGIAPHFQAALLFSMRTKSLVSSQNSHSVDAEAWCKWKLFITRHLINHLNPQKQSWRFNSKYGRIACRDKLRCVSVCVVVVTRCDVVHIVINCMCGNIFQTKKIGDLVCCHASRYEAPVAADFVMVPAPKADKKTFFKGTGPAHVFLSYSSISV